MYTRVTYMSYWFAGAYVTRYYMRQITNSGMSQPERKVDIIVSIDNKTRGHKWEQNGNL